MTRRTVGQTRLQLLAYFASGITALGATSPAPPDCPTEVSCVVFKQASPSQPLNPNTGDGRRRELFRFLRRLRECVPADTRFRARAPENHGRAQAVMPMEAGSRSASITRPVPPQGPHQRECILHPRSKSARSAGQSRSVRNIHRLKAGTRGEQSVALSIRVVHS